jgi:hypothetical protein
MRHALSKRVALIQVCAHSKDGAWGQHSQGPDQLYSLCNCAVVACTYAQGPPGTGKTHVGALVAETIVRRSSEWPRSAHRGCLRALQLFDARL